MGFSIPQLASRCRLTMSADQLNPTPTVAVAFDTEDFAAGTLSRSGSTITGFKAGKLYLLSSNIRIEYTSGCYAVFQLYDVTGAALIQEWRVDTPTSPFSVGTGMLACVPFIPSVDTSVRVDLTSLSLAGTDIIADNGALGLLSYFTAVELGTAK